MTEFATVTLPASPDVVAPDGSNVRILLATGRGSMAHFELDAGKCSIAVAHHTVEEIWYFLGGQGEMWRKQNGREEVVAVGRNTCISIPVGTHFQFRSQGKEPLTAVAITMPPWPGEEEAFFVEGMWREG